MKTFKNHTLLLITCFILVSTLFSYVVNFRLIPIAENWSNFFIFLKFHNMAIGCIFAYVLHSWHTRYINTLFTHKATQALVIAALSYHYMVGFRFIPNPFLDIVQSVLYGLLILNVSSIPNKLVNLEIKPLLFLGRISYGLYMYHMLADYFLRYLFSKYVSCSHFPVATMVSYHVLLLTLTIGIATVSYFFVERKVLALKHRFA